VTIGGGTGTFSLLSHLKKYELHISAIVTMSDSGGSSRMLMDEFQRQLPLGDLRMSLVALARNGALWREVFMHRFEQAAHDESKQKMRGVGGHSLGNLILKGLQDINRGDLLLAVEDAQELLSTAGRVLPVTLAQTMICADLEDGSTICGETDIDTRGKKHMGELSPIARVRLEPEDAPACAQAVRAIRRANLIIIGPGDLYTSVLPNILVKGFAEAAHKSNAKFVYIENIMTKWGETHGYAASDFCAAILPSLKKKKFDVVLCNNAPLTPSLVKRYKAQKAYLVPIDTEKLKKYADKIILKDLVYQSEIIRHDAKKVASAIMALL